MPRKKYEGYVLGFVKLKDNCYINYVSTNRLRCDAGESCEIVFSRVPYEPYSPISYSIYRVEGRYIARA